MIRRDVLDFSNYTGLSPDVHALKAAGWDGVILGTQNPSVTRRQWEACNLEGFHVDSLYCFVYWDLEDVRRISEALQLAEQYNLSVWLDCEWTHQGYPGTGTWAPPVNTLKSLIRKYKQQLGARYAGIYTGKWWWEPYVGNTTEFSGDPLWHAAYQAAQPDFDDFLPYGGWTRPLLWQYSSNGTQGVNADLNVEEVVEPPVPPPYVTQVEEQPWGYIIRFSDGTFWNLSATERSGGTVASIAPPPGNGQ